LEFNMHHDAHKLATEQARFNMIEQQIRPWDVLDGQVLKLLGVLRREHFVPEAHQAHAFMDLEIPLGHGQVMLAPRVQARMLQDLQLKPTDRVLDVGTGSGYMAALCAAMAREVLSLEIDAELASKARVKLLEAGLGNAHVLHADASKNLAAQGVSGTFDAICVNGSVASMQSLGSELLGLLAPGGRLMVVVGQGPVMRATRLSRLGSNADRTENLWDTVAPAMQGFAVPSAFTF
jgi:protein-L-isoaspartate(D-aspartate) O-methyltransferase